MSTDTEVKLSILPRQRPDDSLYFVLRIVFDATVIRDTRFKGETSVAVTREGSRILIRPCSKSSDSWPFETPRSREFIFSTDFLADLPNEHYSKVPMSACVSDDLIEILVPEALPEDCIRKIPGHFVDRSCMLPFKAVQAAFDNRSAQVMALEQSRLGRRLEVLRTKDMITVLKATGCDITPINGVIWRVRTSRHANVETLTISDLSDLYRRRLGAAADVTTAVILEGAA